MPHFSVRLLLSVVKKLLFDCKTNIFWLPPPRRLCVLRRQLVSLFVCSFIHLFAGRITKTLLDRYSQSSTEGGARAAEEPLDFGGNLYRVT